MKEMLCAQAMRPTMFKRMAPPVGCSHRNALRTAALVLLGVLALSVFVGQVVAAPVYWDTDGSTAGNDASRGTNLGGSGIWNSAASNLWNTGLGALEARTGGSEAVVLGGAGAGRVSAMFCN